MGRDQIIEAVAKALAELANAADGGNCLPDEETCFRAQPVHFAWYQLGETGVVGETRVLAEAAYDAMVAEVPEEVWQAVYAVIRERPSHVVENGRVWRAVAAALRALGYTVDDGTREET